MNKVIRREMLAGDLPAELREGLAADLSVVVTIEPVPPSSRPSPGPAAGLSVEALLARHPPKSAVSRDEAVRRIRDLRDEWDD